MFSLPKRLLRFSQVIFGSARVGRASSEPQTTDSKNSTHDRQKDIRLLSRYPQCRADRLQPALDHHDPRPLERLHFKKTKWSKIEKNSGIQRNC